ncbi:MAG: Glutamate-cysteine ligase family, partial [Thermoleophilia bacterium]|nr:Glutamate-cysteine ligase family [Thermoleophilia bacterium]
MTTEFRSDWPTGAPHGTVGVEEEFHLVDPVSGANLAGIEDVLQCGCAVAEREIVQQIAETATPVCETGDDLLRH